MRILDTPIGPLRGRTLRELLVLGGAAAVCVSEAVKPDPNLWHLTFYVGAALLFGARFYAARVILVGFALTALLLALLGMRPFGWVYYADGWHLWLMGGLVGFLLLLCSKDLRARFDRGPSGPGWRKNLWRDLPRVHWALSCWVAYLLGLLGNLVLLPWLAAGNFATAAWPAVVLFGVYAAVILLLLGRSVAFLVATATGALAVAFAWPEVAAAERHLAGEWISTWPQGIFAWSPAFALPAAAAGALVALLAGGYAAYHVRRTLFG
jgi:hypothetical protein